MKYIGFCGAAKSGKTRLCQEVTYEVTKAHMENDCKYYHYTMESFAKPLKTFCVNVLGLTPEQVYGDDKDTLTQYTWGQMPNWPHNIPDMKEYIFYYNDMKDKVLTAREILQWWGTDVFRSVNPDTFIDRLKGRVDGEEDVYIDDVRFANEVTLCDALIHVVGDTDLTHKSEQHYKTFNPHLSIDTRHMGLSQAAKQVCEFLRERFK